MLRVLGRANITLICPVSALTITLLCGPANATTACSASYKTGDLCTCKVLELHPTQFAVGMIAVKDKETELASKSGPTLSAYQRKHPEPVVKASDTKARAHASIGQRCDSVHSGHIGNVQRC